MLSVVVHGAKRSRQVMERNIYACFIACVSEISKNSLLIRMRTPRKYMDKLDGYMRGKLIIDK